MHMLSDAARFRGGILLRKGLIILSEVDGESREGHTSVEWSNYGGLCGIVLRMITYFCVWD